MNLSGLGKRPMARPLEQMDYLSYESGLFWSVEQMLHFQAGNRGWN
jgi:hypothetical protein